ncbi:hypothetical protein GQ600_6098 [Phytophthora cactorum]|nr:hypothetical protein GQ600_6098 [Phytophthora cactorum]
MTSTTHFIAELKALTQQYSLSLPDVDNREYEGFRQSADECLDAVVISFPPDNAINTDRELEMNLETLVHTYTRSSRWDLIQRGYLGNCEPGQGPIEDALIALRNEHKIDSLLACEWELLTLDGTEYLRVRLERCPKRIVIELKSTWLQSRSTAKNDINDDENDNNGDREFIFAAARRDLEVLELQVLRIASIFIFKQEYDSLPTSPHKRSNGRNASQRESDFVVTPIDRLQVLRDIYDCEVAFQQAKVQTSGDSPREWPSIRTKKPRSSELNFTLEAQIDPFADILLPLLHQGLILIFRTRIFSRVRG